jgi:hypothetical protein
MDGVWVLVPARPREAGHRAPAPHLGAVEPPRGRQGTAQLEGDSARRRERPDTARSDSVR